MSWSRKVNWTSGLSLMQSRVVFCSERRLEIAAGSLYLPKADELKPCGDDVHFIYAEKQTVGLADGVGGWTRKGVDTGEYARQLVTNSLIALHNQLKCAVKVNPKMVLFESHSNTKAQRSSTACIITLNGHILRAINIGGSGFMLI
ncbi:hypothetical protein ACSBR2_020120 [Camellia fascicularis]